MRVVGIFLLAGLITVLTTVLWIVVSLYFSVDPTGAFFPAMMFPIWIMVLALRGKRVRGHVDWQKLQHYDNVARIARNTDQMVANHGRDRYGR